MQMEFTEKHLLRENKISREQEHFYVVCLNSINKRLNIELVSLGAIEKGDREVITFSPITA